MQLVFQCPACQQRNWVEVSGSNDLLQCGHCNWSRSVHSADLVDGRPNRCLACGCGDLWRQKDFPQGLGLLFVAIGALLSTIAWGYTRPLVAIGILMVFALADLLLYALMKDVLVCYRCGARHRHSNFGEDHPHFNLEVHERYRQEAMRLEDSSKSEP